MVEQTESDYSEQDDPDQPPPGISHRQPSAEASHNTESAVERDKNGDSGYRKLDITFRSIGKGIKWFRARDASFWNALATILICITTAIYTYYARKQWKEMHDSGTDTHTLALAAKETADTAEKNAALQRQLTISQNAAVIFPMIDFDANGFLNISLANRGKVLATDGSVTGKLAKVSLPDLNEIGSKQSFSFGFPAIRVDDAENKTEANSRIWEAGF